MITVKFIPETTCFMFYQNNNNIMNIFQNEYTFNNLDSDFKQKMIQYAEQLANQHNTKDEISMELEKAFMKRSYSLLF